MSFSRNNSAADASRSPAADEASRRFAHELANLLDGAMRNVNLARHELKREPDQPALHRLDTAALAMQRITTLLKKWMTQGSASSHRLFWQDATLATALQHATRMVEPEAREAGVRVVTHLDTAAELWPCGPAWPAIINVLRNAIEASPAGGCVQIRGRCDGQLVLEITDQGPGLASDLELDADGLPAPGTTTKPEGHGIGLAMGRQVLTSIGGSLTLGRAPHGGTLATLTWPMLSRDSFYRREPR